MAKQPPISRPPPRVLGNFTEGPVHLHLVKLTGFMFMGMAAMITAQLIEAVYVGMLGTMELAAISFTFPLIMMMQSVAMGLGIGASSVIARTAGTGNRHMVRQLISHCLILVVIMVVVMALLGYHNIDAVFTLLGAEGEVLALVSQYMSIWFLGFPLFAISMIGTTLLRSVGDAATPGIVMTFGSVIHVVIAPFLIFGIGPIPRMELEGAAWSFVIARTLSFSYCYYVIIVRERLLIASLDNLITSWKSILHVGIPAIANNLIMPVSMGIITRLLSAHGPAVVAGFGVGSRLDSLMAMIVMSTAMSAGPFIGQNWGAQQYERVDTALSLTNRFCLAWGVFAFAFMLLFGETLVSLINDDPAVVEPAAWFLVIIPLSIGFMGMTSIASSCFNAMGKPMPPLILSIARMFVIYVPLALLFDHLWGYVGIFVATSISNVIVGLMSWQWNRVSIRNSRAARAGAKLEESI